MPTLRIIFSLVITQCLCILASGADANRLTYLDEPCDPAYVGRDFPRLETPQWVGEPGVEAVVVLSIDDMRDPEKYEAFLRPILDRLKKVDGRAPVSIFTNSVAPEHPQLQSWMDEGLSLEVHTIDHPCPCLGGGDFDAARSTYERCVDLMASIPGNQPVAFRMPCCDSINSTSPRFWTEIFQQTTNAGNFLRIDSSVFHLFTAKDPSLPRELVLREDGSSRFRHYLPFPSFVNTIEDYPYPYVISQGCWQFPCSVPSDWEAQHVQSPNNPETVEDMKRALDATVLKKGVYTLVFHPHNWIRNDQIVNLIEHAVQKHGKKVKFLNFAECANRIRDNLLAGETLRTKTGDDNGVRVLDLNDDGFLDVIIGNDHLQKSRVWEPATNKWVESEFPAQLVTNNAGMQHTEGGQFFVTQQNGNASLLIRNSRAQGAWHFQVGGWTRDDTMLNGLQTSGNEIFTASNHRDLGVRLRDLDGDGKCELIEGGPNDKGGRVFRWNVEETAWQSLPFRLPAGTAIVDEHGKDAGLRFVDVDGDANEDVLFSDHDRYSLHLFSSIEKGWDRQCLWALRSQKDEIPMIVRNGTNNGAWFADGHLWVQNEDTQRLPALVDRRSFDELIEDLPPAPKNPDLSLKSLDVRPGFHVELIASEPMVMDPVAFDWGSDGRLWVVEMADYPLGLDDQGEVGGRVRYLRDTTGDGKYDQSTLFADGIAYPTDVMAWREGVLVTAAPNIWYLEDTNGDGRADRKEAWFSGFGEGNQQHRVNGLRWGLDNWVYVANGDSGGVIQSAKTNQRVNISGRDLRIRPDTGAMDTASGRTQHGRGRDDVGNWWGANNISPMFQYVLNDHYLRRNPHVASPDPRWPVATLQDSPLFPISRIMSHWSGYQPPAPGEPSRFTSACGTIVYRDNLFGEAFRGDMFVSEPVHNLIHRRKVETQGITMVSSKPQDEAGREFLRSRDSWFRPTMLRTGPDGCLWVADMYRLVIEHPEWIDDTREQSLDLRAGHERGRIYRVVPDNITPRSIPRLAESSGQHLVDALASPSGTTRDLAHRMLLWHQDKSIADLLSRASRSSNPMQRLHALCVLAGRTEIQPEWLIEAMQDDSPAIRRHAVRIAEHFAKPTSNEAVVNAMAELGQHERDPQVILQLAYTLGEFNDAKSGRALGALLARNRNSPFITAAAISGSSTRLEDVILGIVNSLESPPEIASLIPPILATALGNNDHNSTGLLMQAIIPSDSEAITAWQLTALANLAEEIRKRGKSLDQFAEASNTAIHIEPILTAARGILVDSETPLELRSDALKLLASNSRVSEEDIETWASLLLPQTPRNIQQSTIALITEPRHKAILRAVLARWRSFGPLTRDRLVEAMLQRSLSTHLLLDALESAVLDESDISTSHRQLMIHHRDHEIASKAGKFLPTKVPLDRQRVIDRYLPVVRSGGDPVRGRTHFQKNCGQCHRLGEVGHTVGPDLGALVNLSAEFLTTHILDPHRAVEDKYRNYLLVTVDGRQFNGILHSETATSVTLMGQNNETYIVLKRDIEDEGFKRSQLSMMPHGLEANLDPPAMADVVAFIAANQLPPKSFEGNQPRTVKALEPSGSLRLRAADAALYGPSIVFESKYGNVGFWQSVEDRVQWRFDVPIAGEYDLYLDWALAVKTANQTFNFKVGDQQVSAPTKETGSWDQYQQMKIGTLYLSQGSQLAVMRATPPLDNFLIDLREVCLTPTGEKPPSPFSGGE
ncbi:c-type cytochrome [Rubripirellula sp.]|nr:c-type cytochrome [Rubripirellula sp.]